MKLLGLDPGNRYVDRALQKIAVRSFKYREKVCGIGGRELNRPTASPHR